MSILDKFNLFKSLADAPVTLIVAKEPDENGNARPVAGAAPFFAFDGPEHRHIFFVSDIKDMAALEYEPDYQATETVEVAEEVTEVVGDKAVVKTVTKTKEVPLFDEVPCVDEDGNGICDICGTTHVKFPIVEPKTVKVPRMIEGKKVSAADKARLAELIGQL